MASTSFLTCNRCMQPLRLDESFIEGSKGISGDPSSSSSSNEGGLTKSHYDVISSMLAQHDQSQQSTAMSRLSLTPVPDPTSLQAAVQNHYKKTQDDSTPSNQHPNSLSSRLALHTRLFNLASSFVPTPTPGSSSSAPQQLALGIDHPMCLDCSDFCLCVLRKQIDDVRRERAALKEWTRSLEQSGDQDTVKKMEAEIVDLQHQVKKATEALLKSEKIKSDLEGEVRALEDEERELEAEEAQFWEEHSKLLSETTTLESERATLQRSIDNQRATLQRLNSTNVFFDVFSIGNESSGTGASTSSTSRNKRSTQSASASSSASSLATINGLRFGRVSSSSSSSPTVEWNEVNAAWGQVALLIEVLRCKLGGGDNARFFQGWRIHPRGSTSFLTKVNDADGHADQVTGGVGESSSGASSDETYELYHPGPWTPITRMLHSRRFDAAMVGVLDCTSQLFSWTSAKAHPTNKSPSSQPRMIHHIHGDKIGDLSIRLAGAFGFTSEESWSKACRYLLVNLQVLLNWATKDEVVPVPHPSNGSETTEQPPAEAEAEAATTGSASA